jgi:DNA-binding NtrC family response regulator
VQTIAIIGHAQARTQQIQSDLQELTLGRTDLCVKSLYSSQMDSLESSKPQLMVLDIQTVNRMVFPFIAQVRKLQTSCPIIVIGPLSSTFDVNELHKDKNVFYLRADYHKDQLKGLARNCLLQEKLKQRRDQRFEVKEHAVLEAYSSDYKVDTVINNISRSGVRIVGDLSGLKKGDLLRLHINFDKINKERTMSARVVWKGKDENDQEAAGLEFVSQKAVYQYLLKNAVA